MIEFIDIKTLAFCYGLCCCTQFTAFFLQFRINRAESGLGWWTLGSALMVFGFFVNFARDIQPIANSAIFIYTATFLLCFLFIYIGISEFVENKKLFKPMMCVTGIALVLLGYFVFCQSSIFWRRSLVSFFCAIISLGSVQAVAGGNCKSTQLAHFLKAVFSFNAIWLLALSILPLWNDLGDAVIKRPMPVVITYFLLMITSTLWTLGLIMLVNQKLYDQLRSAKHFLEATLNGLSANIALVNNSGEIVLVNHAWRNFALSNGIPPESVSEGTNYLHICDGTRAECSQDARLFAQGMREVLDGAHDAFAMEYACHSSTQKRWFLGRVTPFPGNGPRMVVVAHEDITERKLAEIALEASNRKLEMMTNEDGLTKISNRRHFDNMLAYEINRHIRSGANLSLILLDIDFFKNFNDTYGHVKGDECLQLVAQTISDCLKRPTDLVARYGGEEFVCLLPDTNLIGAVGLAEGIRQAVVDIGIPHADSQVSSVVTVSMGVVSSTCEEKTTAVQLIQRVDSQLYQAKHDGRNCLKFEAEADEPLIQPTPENNWGLRVVWNKKCLSGNSFLDEQHMELVAIVNSLLQSIIAGMDGNELGCQFSNMLRMVEKHFSDEEEILRARGYPEVDEHADLHERLLQKCSELLDKDASEPVSSVEMLQCIVHDLVLDHMVKEDDKYFLFLKAEKTAL